MSFLNVFKNVTFDESIAEQFEEVEVERLASNYQKSVLKVYITCNHVIEKECIKSAEHEIMRQALANAKMQVIIVEHYHLSEYYNCKRLYDIYNNSLLFELKEESNALYYLLKNATVTFPEDNVMHLVLKDSIIAREKEKLLRDYFYRVFRDRFGLDFEMDVAYSDPQKDKYKEEDEHKVSMMVAEITRKAFGTGEENKDEVFAEIKEGNASSLSEDLEKSVEKTAEKSTSVKETPSAPKELGTTKGKRGKKYNSAQPVKGIKRSDDPEVIYGYDVLEDAITIDNVIDEIGQVVLRGKIISVEGRELGKSNKYLITFSFTDFTDSISAKIFCEPEFKEELLAELKVDAFIKVKGTPQYDDFSKCIVVNSIKGVRKIHDFTSVRMDHSLKKRVELHCHTKMSDSDGVTYVSDLIKRADLWGMPAMAVTDHGVVQAFPDAAHTKSNVKILYGVEAYLVDDLQDTVMNCKEGQTLRDSFVVFDLETTGFSAVTCKIIEIGAVRVENGVITERFSSFVNPQVPIPYHIEKLTSINDSMVANADTIEQVLPKFLEFVGDSHLVAHNASFDMSFIMENCKQQNIQREFTYLDTVAISRTLLTDLSKHTLDAVCKKLGVVLGNHHRAVDDAEATAMMFKKFIRMLEEKEIHTLQQLNSLTALSVERARKLPSYHVIILAKNEVGRVNLYRLVSESHLNYFHRQPKLPKSVINKFREGLIIGSACEAGELYQGLVRDLSKSNIAKIVNFYDYLEIQPLGNNAFMLESDKFPNINTMEDLKEMNRKIVALGEEFHKPVVATCDVHFMDPEDEIYRRIIMAGKGFDDADKQAPLYLRTTEEMLDEFEYLGSDKAEEVVITNTNLVADWCEVVNPIHPDKCPPVIEKSDETLRKICEDRAHELYGEELPDIVRNRLDKELDSIIRNGYSVMYIIAQKLVWKSNEDGYLVGSRGSVGSSFVATMSGITEVNPLSPHYYCKKCHYSDFYSDEVKAYSGRSGCDMPDKNCPVCGEKLNKDGFDIPFETFLGFKGDKEPDIDLNFSGEYQSKAHKYTEVIFGAGQTFRAGTIGTLADKTAFGYVKKYLEERNITKRDVEIDRIVKGCVDVRRTTGQHPGGIIVLPLGYDINQFTPVQHPANDMTTDIITTHFDYHSIDHNLLKLDILGHDDPTMIRMLQDLTGIDPTLIPLDDPQVMTLFRSTDALGITPAQIDGVELGCLGVPEFGTDFVMQMLKDTKPETFSDLIRISGLSHGTDVWLGNAQTLIEEGKATISTAICTRDDIMTYLIHMGVESSLSFTIMESVRKGKGLKPEWEEAMLAANVPDWYIWSCKKIKYMFPKAHAAAYVMMAWRIAYCKVNYPLAYYAAYFSIRASAFSYEIMCQGKNHLEGQIADYKKRADSLTPKEQDTLKDMRIVQEMYARGFEFHTLDIYTANPRHFTISEGKIMPALISVDGLADKAAEGIAEAVKDGPFFSRDDFRERTKVPKTVVEMMGKMGLLGDLPQSNQLSLFDLNSQM